MSDTNITIQVNWRGDAVKSEIDKAVERALTKATIIVDESAKQNAPIDTGRLRASISFEVDVPAKEATIGSNLIYARRIEFGHSKKAPEGYLRPALKENKQKVIGVIQSELKAVTK